MILFDQFSRYAGCAAALEGSLAADARVIDVGCGPLRLLGRFLPGRTVTYLDPLLGADQGDDVLAGTIDRIRGGERRWNWALAVDTLEHVPEPQRDAFVDAMLEVASDGIVLAGPFAEDSAAVAVDARVNEIYRAKTGADYPWLEEHITFGLPSIERVRGRLEAAGLHTITVGNGHAPWLEALLPAVICYLDRSEHLGLLEGISAEFNALLHRFDHFEPVYRRILVARRGCAPRRPELLADTEEARAAAAGAWSAFWAQFLAAISHHADALRDTLNQSIVTNAQLNNQVLTVNEHNLDLQARLERQRADLDEAYREIESLRASLSWRITAGLRALGRMTHPTEAPPTRGDTR
ncbi:MAG: hypothetical protein H6836_04045 [Planctomycetes bacterium]|nr:hypothetical protein [Planctomycetota bacterium]MCB9888726.1 hypothetical protein [Planctomycetota bacterium]